MFTNMTRTAELSPCGKLRHTLTRTWDVNRPVLLVVMFNPSDADHKVDDPTIKLVCQIADHNGFGGIVVVNGIPVRSSDPAPAYEMTNWGATNDWWARDALQDNLATITREVASAGAVLLAWGALPAKEAACALWFDYVREDIEGALPTGVTLVCLGKTKAGHPLHPLARGKLKVPKTAPLLPWKALP